MGAYSEVEACCPQCGSRITIQTKAGPVEYGWYSIDQLPDSVVDDIEGREVVCGCCKYEMKIKTETMRKTILCLKE